MGIEPWVSSLYELYPEFVAYLLHDETSQSWSIGQRESIYGACNLATQRFAVEIRERS